MTDDPAVAELAAYVSVLSEHILRCQAALLVIASDESFSSVTRASIAAALAGEPS